MGGAGWSDHRSSSGPGAGSDGSRRSPPGRGPRRRGDRGGVPRPGRRARGDTRRPAGRAGVAAGEPPAGAGAAGPWADQVVRDGDRVNGRGQVVALPGRPVQLCAPYATIDIYPRAGARALPGRGDGHRARPRPAHAPEGTGRRRLGQRPGRGRLPGRHADRHQAARRPARAGAGRGHRGPGAVPGAAGRLAAPAGRPVAADRRLDAAVHADSETYNGPWVQYPYGWHLQDTSDRKGIEVYLVGTTGDVEAARRELAAVFPAEHLCVTTVRWSKAAMDAAQRQLSGPAAEAAGVSGGMGEVLSRPRRRRPRRARRAGEPVPRRGGRRPGHAAAVAAQGRLTHRSGRPQRAGERLTIRPRRRSARSSAGGGSCR